MSHELDIGISKIARQKVIEHLKNAYANDYLEDSDFEKRLEIAENTRKRSELDFLIEDLPLDEMKKAAVTTPQTNQDVPYKLNRGHVQRSAKYVGIFSGVTRKGEWRPARNIKGVVIMGSVDLDFTNALIPPEGIVIKVFSMMGGIDIRVPEGVNVVNKGFAMLGGFDNDVQGEVDHDAPTITVKGFAFMGGVDIKGPRKPNAFKRWIKKFIE